MLPEEMKVYKLYLAKPLLVFYLGMFAVWIVTVIAVAAAGALGKLGSERPPAWIFLIFLALAFFVPYMWLRHPFEIKIRDDNMIEFRSVLRRVVVSPMEVESVRAKRYALGFVDVKHRGGMVHLLNQMDGFHDFLATLKSLNPAVKIEGC